MGLVDDILQGLPVNSILREKVSQLNADKAAVDEENAILKDDNRELKAQIAKLKKQVEELSDKDDLDATERELIRLVASELETGGKPAALYAQLLGLNRELVQVYLDGLCDKDYLSRFGINGDTFYSLRPTGRAYVLKHKLLSQAEPSR